MASAVPIMVTVPAHLFGQIFAQFQAFALALALTVSPQGAPSDGQPVLPPVTDPSLPAIVFAGTEIPGLLEPGGTQIYNNILTEIMKGYKGPRVLTVRPEANVIRDMQSGAAQCALVRADALAVLQDGAADSGPDGGPVFMDMGSIDSLDVSIYGHRRAPDFVTLGDLQALDGARIAARPGLAARIAVPVTTPVANAREGIRLMLRRRVDYFIGYTDTVDDVLAHARAGTRLKILRPPIDQHHIHIACRGDDKASALRTSTAIKIADIQRTGWIDALKRMR